jgi:hypothetical protein
MEFGLSFFKYLNAMHLNLLFRGHRVQLRKLTLFYSGSYTKTSITFLRFSVNEQVLCESNCQSFYGSVFLKE